MATPDRLSQFQDPSEVLRTFWNRAFPNLSSRGGFKVFTQDQAAELRYNCFAWSLGFTDRWIAGGTVADMERLYRLYHMQPCNSQEAEVDMYRVLDAPAQVPRPGRGGGVMDNKRALVMHAHLRGFTDAGPETAQNLGCSSKMGKNTLLAHNRAGLVDNRGHAATGPIVAYGDIYQHWKRDPAEHPQLGGAGRVEFPVPGHNEQDPIFALGPGRYPAGHPGNNIDAPALSQQGMSNNNNNNNNNNRGNSRTASRSPPPFKAESGKTYPRVPQMQSHGKIPPPSAAAVDAAKAAYKGILSKDRRLVKDFETKWEAWSKTWFATNSSNAPAESVQTAEFEKLAKLGAGIATLVVCKLAANQQNFPGVYLYNHIEASRDFKVSPKDYTNFLVLQRQANLIVDINTERLSPATSRGAPTSRDMPVSRDMPTSRGMPTRDMPTRDMPTSRGAPNKTKRRLAKRVMTLGCYNPGK